MQEAFLPHGYPESVSDDYLAYQIWDTFQAFCSSITGTLATLAVLKGVGVGDKDATPLAATVTWMLKDGTGHLGRILFAWMQGTDLDCNAKRWRLLADVMNDMATFLELLAPIFPYFFLLFVCAASISKAIVGTAGGATRAALVQHQARRDNMADVSAKDGSQETLVNLVALLVNLVLTPNVAGKPELIWALFAVFTFLHLYANYKAVSAVSMETLNQQRLHLTMSDFLSTGSIPSPASVNAREPILGVSSRKLSYSLGVPLSQVLDSEDDYKQAVKNFQKGHRFIAKLHRRNNRVAIALHQDCSVGDQLKAAFVVETLDYIMHHRGYIMQSPLLSEYYDSIRKLEDAHARDAGLAISVALSIVEGSCLCLLNDLQLSGWVTSHHLLGVDEWRYSWQREEEPDVGMGPQ